VAELKQTEPEERKVFLPHGFPPWEAMLVDWGEFTFYLEGNKTRGYFLCFRMYHNCAIYVRALPGVTSRVFWRGTSTVSTTSEECPRP